MTEKSLEEEVAELESWCEYETVQRLIADWRKRGERLEELEHEVIVWRDNFNSEEPWRKRLEAENKILKEAMDGYSIAEPDYIEFRGVKARQFYAARADKDTL